MAFQALAVRSKILQYKLRIESLQVKLERSSRLIVKHRDAYKRDSRLHERALAVLEQEEAKLSDIIVRSEKKRLKEHANCVDVGDECDVCSALYYRKTRRSAWVVCDRCDSLLCTNCSKRHVCPLDACLTCGVGKSCRCSPAPASLTPLRQPSPARCPCIVCGMLGYSCMCPSPVSPTPSYTEAMLPTEQSSLPPPSQPPQPSSADNNLEMPEENIVKEEIISEDEEDFILAYSSSSGQESAASKEEDEMACEEKFSVDLETVVKIEHCSEDMDIEF